VVFAWRDVHEYEVPAEEVARVDRARRQSREALLARLARQDAAS
jgi:cytochrome o ubiquinol oxidase subunit 1